MSTVLLLAADLIFSTSMRNKWKITIQREFEIIESVVAAVVVVGHILLRIFFLYMIYVQQLPFHVQYEEVDE